MTTSREDFINLVKGLDVALSSGPKNSYYSSYRSNKKQEDVPWIYCEWSPGGVSGGSCYGGEPTPYVSSDVPAELDDLDTILEAVAPNITFIQYRTLVKAVVETFDHSSNDYYGNSTKYVGKQCNLHKLYDELIKRGLLV